MGALDNSFVLYTGFIAFIALAFVVTFHALASSVDKISSDIRERRKGLTNINTRSAEFNEKLRAMFREDRREEEKKAREWSSSTISSILVVAAGLGCAGVIKVFPESMQIYALAILCGALACLDFALTRSWLGPWVLGVVLFAGVSMRKVLSIDVEARVKEWEASLSRPSRSFRATVKEGDAVVFGRLVDKKDRLEKRRAQLKGEIPLVRGQRLETMFDLEAPHTWSDPRTVDDIEEEINEIDDELVKVKGEIGNIRSKVHSGHENNVATLASLWRRKADIEWRIHNNEERAKAIYMGKAEGSSDEVNAESQRLSHDLAAVNERIGQLKGPSAPPERSRTSKELPPYMSYPVDRVNANRAEEPEEDKNSLEYYLRMKAASEREMERCETASKELYKIEAEADPNDPVMAKTLLQARDDVNRRAQSAEESLAAANEMVRLTGGVSEK